MSLLELPPELFHWIFDYLDTQTILDSIRPVCTQLDAIVNTYNKLQLDFSSSGISDLRSIADFIQPNNAISLILAENDARESTQAALFVSLFQLDQFTQLQSLTLVEIDSTAMDLFCQYVIARPLPLKLLSIKLHRQTTTAAERIINLLSTTIAQSDLQNLHLNILNAVFIMDNIHQPIQNALRHLTVNSCKYRTYRVILSRCVHLRTFVIGKCDMANRDETVLPSFASGNYRQLTSLTLYRCCLSKDELDLLLSLTPLLVHLKVIDKLSISNCVFNGYLWEKLIQTRLSLLKKFEFLFTVNIDRNTHNSPLDQIIISFRTPFWLIDKYWIVICDFILSSSSQIALHTLPLDVSDSDVVIRCNALSSTNCHRLLTGYWLNHHEHVSTEQVFENLK
jgi:hypothetical protein